MSAITLAEYSKTVQDPLRRGVIETLYEDEPIMGLIPFKSIKGLAYPYNQEEALPGVSFRNINESYTSTYGVVNRKVETLKPFGGQSETDRALIEAYGQAERSSRDRMFTKAMALKFVQTMMYGNSPAARAGAAFTDSKGWDGIQARVTAGQTIDALGSTGSDGSSVFAIRFGDGYLQGLQTMAGVAVEDLGMKNPPAFMTFIEHIAGVGIFHGRAVGWIKNIRASGQVLTVTMMNQLRDLIVGSPDAYIMSKRSRQQLWTSAAGLGVAMGITIDQLGKPVPAWDGKPIYVSDAVIDTETNG